MKNTLRLTGIILLAAMIIIAITACGGDGGGPFVDLPKVGDLAPLPGNIVSVTNEEEAFGLLGNVSENLKDVFQSLSSGLFAAIQEELGEVNFPLSSVNNARAINTDGTNEDKNIYKINIVNEEIDNCIVDGTLTLVIKEGNTNISANANAILDFTINDDNFDGLGGIAGTISGNMNVNSKTGDITISVSINVKTALGLTINDGTNGMKAIMDGSFDFRHSKKFTQEQLSEIMLAAAEEDEDAIMGLFDMENIMSSFKVTLRAFDGDNNLIATWNENDLANLFESEEE